MDGATGTGGCCKVGDGFWRCLPETPVVPSCSGWLLIDWLGAVVSCGPLADTPVRTCAWGSAAANPHSRIKTPDIFETEFVIKAQYVMLRTYHLSCVSELNFTPNALRTAKQREFANLIAKGALSYQGEGSKPRERGPFENKDIAGPVKCKC